MAFIQSGAGADEATVDATSKALRTTLYDSSGNELIKKPTAGSYLANVLIRQSTTTSADAIVWSLFNADASKKCRIRSIRLQVVFDGTTASTTTRAYYLQRTATAAPSSGTTITPSLKRTGDAASVADVRFVDTGLTVGSMTKVYSPFCKIALPISATGLVQYFPIPLYVMAERLISPIELLQNEGIGIFLNENTTAGFGICGTVEWDESTT
jgi:hypothetical protein